jgi:peptide/nickel transport system substrate-binding protein
MQFYQKVSHWNAWECGAGLCVVNVSPLYNTLIEYNPETPDPDDLRGDLAKSWTLGPDGMTYTFRLHETAKWWDGKPVTAEDVAFSLDSIVDPDKPRPLAGQLRPYYAPGNTRAIDPYTVEVKTRFPAAAFLPFLAVETMLILPKHHAGTGIDMKLSESQLGSGPYKLKEVNKDVSVEYTRNPDYFKSGRPYFDGMKWFTIIDHGSVIAAFKAGQVLTSAWSVSNLTNAESLELEKDMVGKGKVYWGGPMGTPALWLNTKVVPLNDVRVRRAINLALYRQPLIQVLTKGMDVLGGPFPPGRPWYLTREEVAQLPGLRELNGEKHPADLAEAKRLMAEAGYPNGFKMTMNPLIVADLPDVAQLVSDQLRRYLNIDVTLKPVELGVGIASANAGDYTMTVGGHGLMTHDPDAYFQGMYIKDSTRNYSRYTIPRIEEIFELQARESDPLKRRQLILEAGQIVMDDPHFIPMYWTMRSWYVDNRLKNFHMPNLLYVNVKFEHLWYDPK